eukprot:gene2753-3006_t
MIGAAINAPAGRVGPRGRFTFSDRQSMVSSTSSQSPLERLTEYLNERPTLALLDIEADDQLQSMKDRESSSETSVVQALLTSLRENIWLHRLFRFFLLYIVGVFCLRKFEGWDSLEACYFITQTLVTVGYGDLVPTSAASRTFVVFYIFVAVLMIFSVISDLTRSVVNMVKKRYTQPTKLTQLQIMVRAVWNCVMWVAIMMTVNLIGGAIFSHTEGWSFSEGFYFAVITTTTVGYGAQPLTTRQSRALDILFMLVAVPITALSLQKISSLKRRFDETKLEQKLSNIELCDDLLQVIRKTQSDRVSRAEYILHMLLLSGKVDHWRDILPWSMRFEEFDRNGDGFLTADDVKACRIAQQSPPAQTQPQPQVVHPEGTKLSTIQEEHEDDDRESVEKELEDEEKAIPRTISTISAVSSVSHPPAVTAPPRPSLLKQIVDESVAVFLETFMLKVHTDGNGHNNSTSSEAESRMLSLHSAIGSKSGKAKEDRLDNTMNIMHGIEMKTL